MALWTVRDPDARYVEIPDADPGASQDNPEVFNRVLAEFLEDSPRPRR
jgi:pimeloyl-ACP methyl ester carboxylesterase